MIDLRRERKRTKAHIKSDCESFSRQQVRRLARAFRSALLELNRDIAGRNLRPIRVHGSASLFGLSDALRKTGPRCGPYKTGRRADPNGTKTSSSRSRSGCGTTFLSQPGVNRGFYNSRSKRSRINLAEFIPVHEGAHARDLGLNQTISSCQ